MVKYVFVFANTQKLIFVFVFVSENFKSCIFVFVFEPCICIKYSQIQYTDLVGIADFNSHAQNSPYYCTVILFFFFNNSWQPCIDFFKFLLFRESRDTCLILFQPVSQN